MRETSGNWNNPSSTSVFNHNAGGGVNENETKVDPDPNVNTEYAGAGSLLKFNGRLPNPHLRDKTSDERR